MSGEASEADLAGRCKRRVGPPVFAEPGSGLRGGGFAPVFHDMEDVILYVAQHEVAPEGRVMVERRIQAIVGVERQLGSVAGDRCQAVAARGHGEVRPGGVNVAVGVGSDRVVGKDEGPGEILICGPLRDVFLEPDIGTPFRIADRALAIADNTG